MSCSVALFFFFFLPKKKNARQCILNAAFAALRCVLEAVVTLHSGIPEGQAVPPAKN